jgi:hypothetical protein
MQKSRWQGAFFMIASPAFRTWSLEQEKSVKSPIETGRCIVADVVGAVLWAEGMQLSGRI